LQISVTGHGIETSAALRAFTADKLSRMDKFAPITKLQVILRAEPKGARSVEAICHLSGGKAVVAKALHDDDSYAAVDLVADKLQRQLSKVQGQRRDRRTDSRRSRNRRSGPPGGFQSPEPGAQEDTDVEDQ